MQKSIEFDVNSSFLSKNPPVFNTLTSFSVPSIDFWDLKNPSSETLGDYTPGPPFCARTSTEFIYIF